MINNESWSAVAAVWDDLFPLRQARVDMCASIVPPGGALLDAGCATGSLVRALLPLGIDACGFDLDPGFVEQAKVGMATESDRVVAGNLVSIEGVFPGRRFHAIVCLGQTFPHLLTDSDVRAFLSGARSRLVAGGRLVLQVVADREDRSDRTLPDLETRGMRLQRRRILTSPDRAELHLVATGASGRSSWVVEHRRWTPGSLEDFAGSEGLRAQAVWSDESKSAWTGGEPGWLLELVAD